PVGADRWRLGGLDFTPAGAPVDVRAKIEQHSEYGEVSGAGRMLEELVAPHIEATYRLVRDVIRSGGTDLVVVNDVGYGALWAASEARVPSVLVHLFFSSRRRHTRLVSDWSSDVCSSD